MLFLCILGFNNVVGWQKENRELFTLTSCGSGWGCCFSWLQSCSGFGEKWCCWKPCLSPHYELHGNAHAHRASWPHSHCQPISAGVTHRKNKKMQALSLPIGRLASRMGKQEESQMPGKRGQSLVTEWSWAADRLLSKLLSRNVPALRGPEQAGNIVWDFSGQQGRGRVFPMTAYLHICLSLPCL